MAASQWNSIERAHYVVLPKRFKQSRQQDMTARVVLTHSLFVGSFPFRKTTFHRRVFYFIILLACGFVLRVDVSHNLDKRLDMR